MTGLFLHILGILKLTILGKLSSFKTINLALMTQPWEGNAHNLIQKTELGRNKFGTDFLYFRKYASFFTLGMPQHLCSK